MSKLSDKYGNFAIMQDVLHGPQLRNGLLSLTRASTEQGFDMLISGNSMIFTDGNVCIETDIVDGLCFTPVDQHNAAAHTTTLKRGAKLCTWHERYGHAANSTIITLAASGNVEGLEILGNPKQDAHDMDVCIGCAMGKIHRSPFPSINNKHSEEGALIHSDTCGPMQVTSFGGNRYLVTFIDDATRFTRGFLTPNKKASTVLEAFKIFKNLAETKLAKHIQAIRTDNGTEYQGFLKDYLKDQDIEHQVTTPYSPESNGVAERYNRTIMEMVRPMLHHPGYPLELWGEAVLAACYLSNRLPSRALDGKTPFEAWFGYKPDVTHLRRWGCVAYAHIPKELRKKLDVKGYRGIFVGYDNPNGTYRIFDPATNKIISTKDWIISENEFWDFVEGSPRTSSAPNVETVMLEVPTHIQTHAHPIAPKRTQSPTVGTVTPQSEHLSPAPSPPASASPEGSVEPEIQVLPIPRAPAIPAPPPSPLPEDEDQGPRKSGRQTKPRDFWEGGFAALLATMAVAEAPV